jgi:hypothetical protein
LRRFLKDEALDLYLDSLIKVCHQGTGEKEERKDMTARQRLLDAFSLKCPNPRCAVVVDPTPDGCAAVRCGGCGTYICFLCFQACSSNAACHQHVAACKYSPVPGSYFVSDKLREVPNKRMRIIALREVLADVVLSEAARRQAKPEQLKQLGESAKATQLLAAIQRDLADVLIFEEDLLNFDTEARCDAGARNALDRQKDRANMDRDHQVIGNEVIGLAFYVVTLSIFGLVWLRLRSLRR